MIEPLKIGFIGFGNYAKSAYYSFLKESSKGEIVGISCDLDSKNKGLKYIDSIPFIFDTNEMLDSIPMDLVIVSTPHSLHYQQVNDALSKGVNVLVDKPLACNTEKANLLFNKAKENRLLISVGLERRFETLYVFVKELINKNYLGRIERIECEYFRPVDKGFENSWRNNSKLSCGGILMDAGVHIIDTLIWLMDLKLNKISGSSNNGNYNIEKECSISCEFKSNIKGNFFLTYDCPKNFRKEEIWVYGTKGKLGIINYNEKGDQYEPKIICDSISMGNKFEIPEFTIDKEMSKSKPLEDIMESILLNSTPKFEVNPHLETIKFINQFYKSIEKEGEHTTLHSRQ